MTDRETELELLVKEMADQINDLTTMLKAERVLAHRLAEELKEVVKLHRQAVTTLNSLALGDSGFGRG